MDEIQFKSSRVINTKATTNNRTTVFVLPIALFGQNKNGQLLRGEGMKFNVTATDCQTCSYISSWATKQVVLIQDSCVPFPSFEIKEGISFSEKLFSSASWFIADKWLLWLISGWRDLESTGPGNCIPKHYISSLYKSKIAACKFKQGIRDVFAWCNQSRNCKYRHKY